jgi:protein-S-isoprenylcysteine O-methyltransferase Ste14
MRNLALRSFLGIVNLAVMMSLALFLPAGTIHFTQAWWYLAIFFGGVVTISIYIFINDKHLLQSRLKAGATAEKRKVQKLVQSIASIGFIAVYIIAGFDHRYHWSDVPLWLSMFSVAFVMLAMLLFFLVFKTNTYLSATIETQKEQQVISNGPYAIVRHPMYSAALLLFMFTPLALDSYWALLSFPLMVVVLILRSIDEEQALKEELQGYEEYCKKVKYRLIPFIY